MVSATHRLNVLLANSCLAILTSSFQCRVHPMMNTHDSQVYKHSLGCFSSTRETFARLPCNGSIVEKFNSSFRKLCLNHEYLQGSLNRDQHSPKTVITFIITRTPCKIPTFGIP